MLANFPSTFELLPSKKYYTLYQNSFPFSDDRDIDGNGEKNVLNYDQLKMLLSNIHVPLDFRVTSDRSINMPLFDKAESYHDALDESFNISDALNTDTNGVKIYLIAGSGHPTIGQIHDYYGYSTIWGDRVELPFGPNKVDADAINGDDTVPLLSATLGKLSHVYYVNQTHSSLPSGTALQMTYNLLNGQIADIPGVQPVPFAFNGKIISVHSPVLLHAYDNEGNHTGPKEDGTIEVGIPGSSYDYLGESKFIYLPSGGDYNIKTKATEEGTFDLKIKSYTDSALSKEQLYLSVPQTAETTATMILDSDNPILHVDTDNNGTADKDLSPSSTLSGGNLADIQAPETIIQASGTKGTGDWYRSNVTLSFSAEDSGAGVLKTFYYKDGEQSLHEEEPGITIDTEGTTKLWYFSVDKAGNSEQPKSITIKIDKTNPTITYSSRTEVNENGWNKMDVTVNWTCADQTSGAVDGTISQTITTEGENQSVTGVCADKAGNTVENTQSGIKIDKAEPLIMITTPQKDAVYILNSSVNASWSVSDDLSGIASSNGTAASGSSLDTGTVGVHEFTVNAADAAGNTASKSVTYKVIYRFDGFLQPINDTGHEQVCGSPCTVSIFKGGNTVPVKFHLKDANGNIVQSIIPPQWITPQQGSGLSDSINESDFTDSANSETMYSWDGTQYHYNWKTKDIPSGFHWLIGAKMDDGQTYTVNIGLR